MPILPVDRSHESVINDALATLFRERAGLVASSETLHIGVRPDIIVRTPDGPVIVEVELEPARIELDRRVVREMLGLANGAEDTVKRLRWLLASEPSIHGSKKPELPASEDY